MYYDVVIIGGGIAGLNIARDLDPKLKVAVITKEAMGDGASVLAQGGIASVSPENKGDSFESHIKDTLSVGAGLCNKKVVEYCIKHAPEAIKELLDVGVPFSIRDIDEQHFDLTKEGGHSHRRIYHSGDITGEAIIQSLKHDVRKRKNVAIFEHSIAINLIALPNGTIGGVYVFNEPECSVKTFTAGATVLATGGAGKAYLYTSNPDTATGDGVAMAYRAGAEISNMEFYQFHPTCLYHPEAKNFLISEAVRGEGGILRLKNGDRFMKDYHEKLELAPRDVVARAIDKELKRTGDDCVYLDVTHLEPAFIKTRFPNIYDRCLKLGIDITKTWIPVVPAAHYSCGGIKVDIDGRTNLKGLWACGECASTGLHGANRLASNSLLEAMVFSKRIAVVAIEELIDKTLLACIPEWESSWTKAPEERVMVHNNWDELRLTMWNNVGIVRSMDRLMNALKRIEIIKAETESYYWNFELSKDLIELRNIVCVAEIIVRSAMSRKESRGLHYLKDFPETDVMCIRDTLVGKN